MSDIKNKTRMKNENIYESQILREKFQILQFQQPSITSSKLYFEKFKWVFVLKTMYVYNFVFQSHAKVNRASFNKSRSRLIEI